MILIHFHIEYRTRSDEHLVFVFSKHSKRKKEISDRILCFTYDGINWQTTLGLEPDETLEYAYQVSSPGKMQKEYGLPRIFSPEKRKKIYFIKDFWRIRSNINEVFFSSAFTEIIFKRPTLSNSGIKEQGITRPSDNVFKFQLRCANIQAEFIPGVVGDTPSLGNWTDPILLSGNDYPNWSVELPLADSHIQILYKYVICDPKTKKIVEWESGENRSVSFLLPGDSGNQFEIHDEFFRYSSNWWKAAGVAIPVFSLRTHKSFGIGEFRDLNELSDFAYATALRVIQVLPVNDTLANMTWKDCYPYAAISVFALHPLYLNLPQIGSFTDPKVQKSYQLDQAKLNSLDAVDFEQVMKLKFKYLRILYQQYGSKTLVSDEFQSYFHSNDDWLKPYAAFCYLRDHFNNPDFNTWGTYSKYHQKKIEKLSKPGSDTYDSIAFYYFLQFHADKQLKEARAYGQTKGVVLKGDLPIGIYRYSSDAWVAPHLYNMDTQAGAPPDDYAVLGQNWGFPTYNWQEMSKNNFLWWQQRMLNLAQYFDALRIDHILGFFRIWEIPSDQVEGTMGLFNPRMPYTQYDLENFGIDMDLPSNTQPFINSEYIEELFDSDAGYVITNFLNDLGNLQYNLKEEVNSQRKINTFFSYPSFQEKQHLIKPLQQLVSEILLIEEPGSNMTAFNPRITLHTTFPYKNLNEYQKRAFNEIYHDYFHVRHNAYWREQAMWKLPTLLDSSSMLICGEDLGMIPASVPEVMKQLNIIPLEIQRMPKGNTQFGRPSSYDYFSVCSPSCHDMSTIRGWWESSADIRQSFYSTVLGNEHAPPDQCHRDIVAMINQQHLNSPSILAIFPIQDLLGMNDTLKFPDAAAEQINEPSNPNHYWRYRLHIHLEDLLNEEEFIKQVKEMVVQSGRDQ